GRRFSHTLDPRTGYPVTHNLASVTVLAATAAEADALATVFMVLGAEHSLAFAEERRIPLFLLVKEGDGFREVGSSAFVPYIGGAHD
ncbi:MAG: FAD:protein FMN transferase, partial [Bacteroidales bacterium]|nr:FAD:protein FMN transferase [Bacteroidales bacterium]